MSSVSESISEHTTIGDVRRRYSIKAVGTQHDAVTLTSVADALEDITPGALYISSTSEYDPRIVHAAARRGAYAVIFMLEDKAQSQVAPIDMEIPVLFANMRNDARARIAADLAGQPSRALAVFAIQGSQQRSNQASSENSSTDNSQSEASRSDEDSQDSYSSQRSDIHGIDDSSEAEFTEEIGKHVSSNRNSDADADIDPVVSGLYDLLHYLGNPLGVIDKRGGISLERELHLHTPLSPIDIQRMLFVMVEDGATSVIIHIDDSTLEALSLTKVDVDVYTNTVQETFNVPELGTQHSFRPRKTKHDEEEDLRRVARQNVQPYGATIHDQTMCVETTDDARDLVREALGDDDSDRFENLATAVSMVLAAGVKRNSVKSALQLSHEMKADKS